ncbi:MAG: hypothetical protein HY645_09270 [Acidobacteria bacterium]|nr:hypothetical protein [Acidobacteriota bacterium]
MRIQESETKLIELRNPESGNRCEVYIEVRQMRIRAQWECFPPSEQDLQFYAKACFPQICDQAALMLGLERSTIIGINRQGMLRLSTEEEPHS